VKHLASRPARAPVAAVLAVGALLLAACGGGDDGDAEASAADADASQEPAGLRGAEELAEAAAEEGNVTVYSSHAPERLAELVELFNEQYPDIEVEIFRGIDADIQPKVEAERSTGNVIGDLVVMADKGWVTEKAAEGWFLAPEGPELTGEGGYDAAQYVHEGNYFEVSAAVLTFAWNTGVVPDGLDDYADLLDPSLSGGQIGVIDPSAGSIVDYYWWLEETFGDEFVEDLAAQEPRIYPSALPIGEALASGEISAAAYAAPATLDPAKDNGAPVEYGLSDEGVWGARYLAMVPDGATHPNAAMLFANFMLTPTGQEAIAAGAGSALPDVPGTLVSLDEVRVMDLARLTPENVADYQARWSSLFQ
jgi:iron(III) transport system substrate-binding protein